MLAMENGPNMEDGSAHQIQKGYYNQQMLSHQEMTRFNRQIAEIEKHFHESEKLHVEYTDILSALMIVWQEANPEIICKKQLSTAELIESLKGFVFNVPKILGEIVDSSIGVPGSIRKIYASLVNSEGEQSEAGAEWEILWKNEDPFPSNPCAHNEAEDITLDLATGSLYHDREIVHRLRKKELANFRLKISEKYPRIPLPLMAE